MTEHQAKKEEFVVTGDAVVKKVKELINEGNIRRVIIRDKDDKTIMEFPVTFGVVGAVLALMLNSAMAADAGKAAYSIAVVPQFRAEEIHRDWTPVLERLRAASGATFSLRIARDIPAFEDSVLAGEADGGIGFIASAIGRHPQGMLGHPRPIAQRGFTGITGFRVDL